MINSFLSAKLQPIFFHKALIKIFFTLIIIFGLFIFSYRFNDKLYKLYQLINGKNVFNFSFNHESNFGWNKKNPPFGELLDWAKQFKGKMFIVPLLDSDISTGFRFITKNSTYISFFDMGQLSYTPLYYFQGFDRLQELGFVWVGRRGFDLSAYNKLTISEVKKLDADFIIFDKQSALYTKQKDVLPIYENSRYITYQLR